MCGIVGAIAERNVVPILLEGLRRLEYRGYDSAGIAAVADGSLARRRRLGKVAELEAALTEQPVTSRVVGQMERDGLVIRKPARDDSRAVEVWISRKGQSLFTQLLPQAKMQIDQLVSAIPSAEASSLAVNLQRMLDHTD